jgi:TatD DNase family protein
MRKLIDTHAHLYDERFVPDLDQMLARAEAAGVGQILMPNCDWNTVALMLTVADKYPQRCLPMLGLHPCYVGEDFSAQLDKLEALFEERTFCAVGEIGLDYYWDKTFVEQQEAAFARQIGWAKSRNLPIVIHSREATTACLDIVERESGGTITGILHCFSGTEEEAWRATGLGLHLGFGGVVTYKKTNLPEIAQAVGLDWIVLETDAPYLAPIPFRGKRNEPAYVPLMAERLAGVLNLPVEAVAKATTTNAEKIFGLSDWKA